MNSIKRFEGRGAIPYNPALDRRTPTYTILPDFGTLIAKAQGNILAKQYGGLDKTLQAIQTVTQIGVPQVGRLAQHLSTGNMEQDCYHVWHFCKTQINYKLDTKGREEIRTPARSWVDRVTGIDCEDYSIFAVCTLLHLGYTPEYLIVAFNHKPNFGHIYVRCGQWIIDPVVGQFHTHPPNVTKTKVVPIR